ncbi:MAG TPA: hypothetical protein VE131_06300, partial [Terriglobales bacterium]|nr:hypothetical protein [Terriglobales bacterium]
PVAVARQLFNKPETENALFFGMVENMESYEIPEEILITVSAAHRRGERPVSSLSSWVKRTFQLIITLSPCLLIGLKNAEELQLPVKARGLPFALILRRYSARIKSFSSQNRLKIIGDGIWGPSYCGGAFSVQLPE